MNTSANLPQSTGSNKTLWAAVAVLGIAVLAMGATLIRVKSQPVEPHTAVLAAADQKAVSPAGAASLVAQAASAQAAASTAVTPASQSITQSTKNNTTNLPQAQVKHAQSATKSVATEVFEPGASPRVVHPQNPEPAVARAPQPMKTVCANCGTVQSVTPVEVKGAGSGAGAIAGGVLGAVVGNQVGAGDGKTLATILGAVGGGMAGNAVEKNIKKITHYEVTVRMDDGSHRLIRQTTPATVGSQVTVVGDTLQSR